MKTKILKANLISAKHGFSTRIGGASTGIYDSLNLGMNRGDDSELVKKNWDLFLDACGIDNKEFVCGNQVHSNNVHIATKKDLRPAYGPGELIEADGYVTNEKGVTLAIFTADCVPVILEDMENGVIGCVHAGWRSAVKDIEGEAVKKMIVLGAVPSSIKVAIGPAIEQCCFEVGREVIDAVCALVGEIGERFFTLKENGKYMLDLKGVVKERFIQLGVSESNIEMVGECTMCNPDLYWSHRYTKGERGSQASVITL